MNNKPVAWMDYLEHSDVYDLNVSGRGIPLYTQPVKEEHFEDEPQAEELHEIMQSNTHPVKEQYKFGVDWSKDGNAVTVLKICEDGVAEVVFMDYQKATHPVKEQDESFDRTASHMAGEYVSWTSCVACGQRVTGDSIHTCSPQLKQLTDEEIIEFLAELEHEQWMKWADTIMQTEKISDARFARWASCMIPYADLTEEMKEFDREWARKALAILRKAQEK